MPELKEILSVNGFSEVMTYLNSGNVIFSSATDDTLQLSQQMSALIQEHWQLNVPVCTLAQVELQAVLANAPEWWGNSSKEMYDNLIVLFPSLTYDEVIADLGAPHAAYEQVAHFENTIFWSFVREAYQKTNWWSKTARSKVSKKITIRTANTIRKIAVM